MQSLTKRVLTPTQLTDLVHESTGLGCRVEGELTDGWFSTVFRLTLDDGRPAVIKFAPPSGLPVLRYERGILGTEALVYRRTARVEGIPVAELLHESPDFLLLSVLDGSPWSQLGELPPDEQAALRRELGRVTAALHTLAPADGRFGYPAAEAGLSGTTWSSAFRAMVDALLDDAARWESPLGVPAEEIARLVEAGAEALDEVTEPRLVHFDLWPGNVFVQDGRITGLIDHERAFWGDPAAELVSLDFGGPTGPDSDLMAGYHEAGGELPPGPGLARRLALYRLYLGLILVVECGPRGYDAQRVAEARTLLDPWVAAVRAVSGGRC